MKAAILYLTQKKDINYLIKSINLLSSNFIINHQYPILILEDDLNETDIERIKSNINDENTRNLIHFYKINFLMPSSLDLNPILYDPPLDRFKIGYRNMCRFFSGEIFKFFILKDYDWIWRLDSDSFILNKIGYDVFDFMKKNKKVYAYISEYAHDQPFVVNQLFEYTKKFIETKKIKTNSILEKKLNGGWNYEMFYTNFEILNMNFFKNSGYMDYYQFLDETNNIYYKRWGDAPIRWFGVNMFAKEENIFCIKDIAYQHQHWIKNT